MPKTPYWFKMFLAKLFIRCLKDLEVQKQEHKD